MGKRNIIYKLIFYVLFLGYISISGTSLNANIINAVLTLFFSVLFFWKSRRNLPVSLIAFFILYCNYSVVISEYLVGGKLGVPLVVAKTPEIYGILIKLLLLLIGTITVFYNNQSVDLKKYKLIPKDNVVIFYGLILILIYIFVFGVQRGDLSSYTVRISPLYEYSTLLFLFAYYFSGKSKIRKSLIVCLLVSFVLQDFYYGGRITSIQLIFLFLLTMFSQKLSLKFIIFNGFIGIAINSLVGVYRVYRFSFSSISIVDFLMNLKNSYFVFDTPVYAYYTSATHVMASNIAGWDVKINSFMNFIITIFIGSRKDHLDLTDFVSQNYISNVGGGMLPSHFYFWLGWSGVILISFILLIFINRIGKINNDFQKLCSIVVIVTVPRWYCYSPLSLFRPLVFLSILYLIIMSTHKIFLGIAGKNRNIKVNNPTVLK